MKHLELDNIVKDSLSDPEDGLLDALDKKLNSVDLTRLYNWIATERMFAVDRERDRQKEKTLKQKDSGVTPPVTPERPNPTRSSTMKKKIERILDSVGEWSPEETAELAGELLCLANVDDRANVAAFLKAISVEDRGSLVDHIQSIMNDEG